MKNVTFLFCRRFPVAGLILIAIALNWNSSSAQNTWTKKSDFGGTSRYGAIGFSIDTKGYIGTGYGSDGLFKKDFWEYDPATDVWTQKADFGGIERSSAVGFSIGNKGYAGTGFHGGTPFSDFWEYDPVSNAWTQKADFAGQGKVDATGFSIGNKGYVGLGQTFQNDFWEYDPATDVWTRKADFGGTGRAGAAGFSIGSKGYIATGLAIEGFKNDLWEYDPATDTWTRKSDFTGTARFTAVGFSIGGKGYVGTGTDFGTWFNDFWRYDPVSNTWTQVPDFGGAIRERATGFSIRSKGYVGLGIGDLNTYYNDFWESPDTTAIGCSIPIEETTSKITSASAKLNWDAVIGAEKYKLRYEVGATNDWTVLYPVAHHKTVTDLVPSTEYTWQVKTICKTDSPALVSAWSPREHFTTSSLRLDEQKQLVFQLYPNPSSGVFTINLQTGEAITTSATIKILNALGQTIYTSKEMIVDGMLRKEIQLNNAVPGMYLVKVTGSNLVYTSQINLQK